MTTFRFDDQVALVTGSGAGPGLAYARELARRGAKVAVTGAAPDGRPLDEVTASPLRAEGLEVVAVQGDVATEQGATSVVEETVARLGRIDILVNSANTSGFTAAHETSTDVFTSTLTTHLYGAFWTMREALRHMRDQNYGRIVNSTSAHGVFGAPEALPYATATAAVIGLTRAAALDNHDLDIRVNAVAPIADTDGAHRHAEQHPDSGIRYLDDEHVAPAVAYLCHRDCHFRGETLATGAGRVARLLAAAVPGYRSATMSVEEIAAHLDPVVNTSGFRILASSAEQYDMLPRFTA